MVHLVYLIKFESRIYRNEPPFYYIGSKTNATYINGKIVDKHGKFYYGSSRHKDYKKCIENETFTIDLLYSTDDVYDALERELSEQKKVNAKTNPLYFNLSYANTKSNYSLPGYGTYKHIHSGKIVRLKVDDELVISGEYVGATKGHKLSDDTKNKISIGSAGKNNGFYGKKHTAKAKNKISLKNKGKIRSDKFKAGVSKRFKGIPKTEEHKNKIGRSDMVMLKHPETLHSIRVHKTKEMEYKLKGYLNPYAVSILTNPYIKCPFCSVESKSKPNMFRWHFDNCKHKMENK